MTDFGTSKITVRKPQAFTFPDNWPKRDDLEGRLDFLLSMMGETGYRVFDTQLSSDERRAIRAWMAIQRCTDRLSKYNMAFIKLAGAFSVASLSIEEFRKQYEGSEE